MRVRYRALSLCSPPLPPAPRGRRLRRRVCARLGSRRLAAATAWTSARSAWRAGAGRGAARATAGPAHKALLGGRHGCGCRARRGGGRKPPPAREAVEEPPSRHGRRVGAFAVFGAAGRAAPGLAERLRLKARTGPASVPGGCGGGQTRYGG